MKLVKPANGYAYISEGKIDVVRMTKMTKAELWFHGIATKDIIKVTITPRSAK